MADLEDCGQPPRVVAVLCAIRGGVPVPLKQPLAGKPLVLPVMGGPRQLDSEFHLPDPFLTEPENYFLLGAKGSMDNKFPPSNSLEEIWIVHADFPFATLASDGCSMGLQLTKFIPDHEHIFGLTSDCKIGVSQINVACFPHGFLQVPNCGMDGEQGLGVVQEFFGLSEEEETKLYSKYPAKILWSSSLDMWLHCVPWFVGKGRPLKSNYNAEHGHAETIMHALGVHRALVLGAGTGSSSSNAVMVDIWLDSGASCHVVGNEEILSNLHDPPAGGRPLRVADGFEHKVESIGTIDIPGFRIPNVRFIRRFENLISVGQLAEDHKIRSYLDEVCCILWVGQELTLVGEGIKDKRNGLYRLTFLVVP